MLEVAFADPTIISHKATVSDTLKPILEASKIEWNILTEAKKLQKMFWLFAPQWKKVDFCFSFLETKSFGRKFFFVMTLRWQLFENFLSRVGRGEKIFCSRLESGDSNQEPRWKQKEVATIFRRRFDACELIIQKPQIDFSGTKKLVLCCVLETDITLSSMTFWWNFAPTLKIEVKTQLKSRTLVNWWCVAKSNDWT